jgi:excinuclease ABC subunit B
MTVPQLKAMYHGDLSRKQTLVDYGFRLPCAIDNRPLKYDEFDSKVKQLVYISATPGDLELELCGDSYTELIIRPTGLVDPVVEVLPTRGQIDKVLELIQERVPQQKVIINTLTKKMAEDLSDFLLDHEVRARYLHSEIKSLERMKILNDLRKNEYDVLVGVNLLREGVDLPEVALVCIMDADKEGFLRNNRTLIQMIGRAARNADSKVVLFADKETKSMKYALDETIRRREIQLKYNEEHGIVPKTILKSVSNPILDAFSVSDEEEKRIADELLDSILDKPLEKLSKRELIRAIDKLEAQMHDSAKDLDFEKAAFYRDTLKKFRERLEEKK